MGAAVGRPCHDCRVRPVRITTWNLQGRERPDIVTAAGVIRELEADVVLLQEVQRSQARALGHALGWPSATWHLKHWPLVIPPEGLAVLSRLPVHHAESRVLARRWAFWSSHRRIAVVSDIPVDDVTLRVVDTHLGAGVGDAERVRQAALVVDLAALAPLSVIGGDLNTAPGSPVIEALGAVGHRDGWSVRGGDEAGPTNWRPGRRHEAPVQRLDYLLVGPGLEILDISVPRHGEPGFERFGPLSDHLPVTATLQLEPGS